MIKVNYNEFLFLYSWFCFLCFGLQIVAMPYTCPKFTFYIKVCSHVFNVDTCLFTWSHLGDYVTLQFSCKRKRSIDLKINAIVFDLLDPAIEQQLFQKHIWFSLNQVLLKQKLANLQH